MSLESATYFEIVKFARQEGIEDRQAIKWLITEGLKSFNGIDKQSKLQSARLSSLGREKE